MAQMGAGGRGKKCLFRQTSLGVQNPYPGGRIERLGSPKLQKQSYSVEQYPAPLSLIRPSASMGSIPAHRQRLQARGGLNAFRSSQSLLLEEPEIQQPAEESLSTALILGTL